MQLNSTGPVRPLKLSRRALTGKLSLAGSGVAGHESSLEKDLLIALDFDWRVIHLQEQPYRLTYSLDGQRRHYTPDILATFDDGTRQWTVVFEVKYREQLKQDWAQHRPRYKAAVHDCRSKGWRFKIATETTIRTPYTDNARFLRRYRSLAMQVMHRDALLLALTALGVSTPATLLEATWYDMEKRMAALSELWRMVAQREIAADLTKPLTMKSPIWLP